LAVNKFSYTKGHFPSASITMTTRLSLLPRLEIHMLYLNIFSCLHDMMFRYKGQFYKQLCLCVAKLP